MPLTFDELWDGPLTRIRAGQFSSADDEDIRKALDACPVFLDPIPREIVTGLWFMPMFLEWQMERIAEKSPSTEAEYRALVAWVTTKVGDILGYP